MKQFQLYVRKHELDQWQYADTYDTPDVAWAAMQHARARNCQTRISRSGCVGMDHTVLAVTAVQP